MMFGEIVSEIVDTAVPVDMKFTLANVIANPIEMHVHGLGMTLVDRIIDNARGALIMSLNGSGRLRIPEFIEGVA